MNKVITCVYDKVSELYYTPNFERSVKAAVRGFQIAIKDAIIHGGSLLSTNYYDFQLLYLGKFDDETGKFDVFDHPTVVFDGSDYVISDDTYKEVTDHDFAIRVPDEV